MFVSYTGYYLDFGLYIILTSLYNIFRKNARSTCEIIAGSPTQSLQDCVMGEIIDGSCDAFFDEECEYHGHDIGVSAPAGEVTNVIECEEYCHLFQVLLKFCLVFYIFKLSF